MVAGLAHGQGNLPPPYYLKQLLDVAISSPGNNQVLTYNSATGKWKNATSIAGGGSITSGVTPLVNGQSYIDVTFPSAQPDATWLILACNVFNTLDSSALILAPGTITAKTTTGFRVQFNGAPDSGNYYLQWGITAGPGVPSPSPSATFTPTVTPGGPSPSATPTATATATATFTPTPTPTAFDPSSLPNLKMWLKADALALTDGAAVSSWTDSSGNGNALSQATGANQPVFKTAIVNGKPVVRFDGVNDILFNSATTAIPNNTTPFTIFAVAKAASISAGSHQVVFTGNSTGGCVFIRRDADTFNYFKFDGGFPNVTSASAITAGAWKIFTCDWDLSNMHGWIHGTSIGSAASSSSVNSGGGVSVGAGSGFGGAGADIQFWDGDVAEVLIYNAALSSGDRGLVETYLEGKYGL